MAKKFDSLSQQHIDFIGRQQMFFVATAAPQGRVNLSPKGLDSLRVKNPNTVHWLNLTGSGNETAAHLLEDRRMTLMFCSFSAAPLILRLYGNARAVHLHDEQWPDLISDFDPHPGARQIYVLDIDLVQTSCGYAVPQYDFVNDRHILNKWSEDRQGSEMQEYWATNNAISLDGKDTGVMPPDTD